MKFAVQVRRAASAITRSPAGIHAVAATPITRFASISAIAALLATESPSTRFACTTYSGYGTTGERPGVSLHRATGGGSRGAACGKVDSACGGIAGGDVAEGGTAGAAAAVAGAVAMGAGDGAGAASAGGSVAAAAGLAIPHEGLDVEGGVAARAAASGVAGIDGRGSSRGAALATTV